MAISSFDFLDALSASAMGVSEGASHHSATESPKRTVRQQDIFFRTSRALITQAPR